jgi:hypothetical protein
MKITDQILSIPPYISTAWTNVVSLSVMHTEEAGLLLVVALANERIIVPNLGYDLIKDIFSAHARSMESRVHPPRTQQLSFQLPSKLLNGTLEKMGFIFQHNPEEADAEALPEEILEKFMTLIKELGITEMSGLPSPKEGCHCHFCQIFRVIQEAKSPEEKDPSENQIVKEEELQFRNWDVASTGDRLYDVINRLDHSECYQVYLGEPIGCTCGNPRCEHIRAVLLS